MKYKYVTIIIYFLINIFIDYDYSICIKLYLKSDIKMILPILNVLYIFL